MRELDSSEILAVGGALSLTTPLTAGLLNSVSNFNAVTKLVTAAFGVGYAIGTFLNDQFDISTKIVDAITD